MIQPTTRTTTNRPTIPPGVYVARCYRVVYLGTRDTGFKTETGAPNIQNQLFFTFEIPSLMAEFNGEQKPLVISSPDINFKFYVADKPGARVPTLNTYIEALLGRQITKEDEKTLSISSLNGNACLIKVVDNKGYPKIETVMPMLQGMECPPRINFPSIFDWRENFSKEVLEKFPEFIRKKIYAAYEYQPLLNPTQPTAQPVHTASAVQEVPDYGEVNPEDIHF